MSRKHFEMIAESIHNQFEIAVDEDSVDARQALRSLAYDLADKFAMENPNFSRDKFINAAIPY